MDNNPAKIDKDKDLKALVQSSNLKDGKKVVLKGNYPNLPDELKDKVVFVDTNDKIVKDGLDILMQMKTQESQQLLNELANSEFNRIVYDTSPIGKKSRKCSNKKYHKRKKAKNGRTKRRK